MGAASGDGRGGAIGEAMGHCTASGGAADLWYSPAMSLTGKQRRHLRALGHELAPVAQVGKGGLSTAVIAAVDRALADHELVKIKLLESLDVDRDEAAAQLAAGTQAEIAQVLGRTVLLYRPDPDEPRIKLPKAARVDVNED